MATAVALNATSSIINEQGLGVSPALLSAISTYQANPALASYANVYVNAGISPSQTANIISQLNTIGTTITSGHFLLDLYPGNITPICSATITPWVANLVVAVGSLISNNGKIYTTTGNIFSSSFDANVLNNSTLTGFSGVIKKQAQLPFASGLSGFANVFQNSYSYSQQVFDTVSSISLLQNTTYNQTGVGYTGPSDLVSGGIGTQGQLLANVVAGWGTMYDINNVTTITDPYVFGQNLLNQGLGYVNALSDQLTSVGLDITDLTDISATVTTTVQSDSSVTISSFVGEVELPTIIETTTTIPVTGSSPTVITNIYKTVTGSNLQVIVNATAITNASNQITTLNDYLDFNKVVDPSLIPALNSLDIYTFTDFSKYLGNKVGQGRFKNWAELSEFLQSLETPALTYLPTGATTNVLYNSTITTLNNQYGTGSGTLGNPVMIDYLGACAGDPYTPLFGTINSNYNSFVGSITPALAALDKAVIDYSNAYNAYLASEIPDSAVPPDPPAGDGVPPDPSLLLPFSIITSNVAAVNTALSSLTASAALTACDTAVYRMLNHLTVEVANLVRAGVVFGPGTPLGLLSFAESIGQLASNKTETETYQFFANVITNNLAGDTIRAVVAETINNQLLTTKGITNFNDPDPRFKIYQSQTQNIPLSTYLSRNK